jgi:hypothetical protein
VGRCIVGEPLEKRAFEGQWTDERERWEDAYCKSS